jgi:hypothetical protein
VAGYAEDGGYDTAVASDYSRGTETISEQKPDGTTTAQTVAFDLARNGGTLASVSHDAFTATWINLYTIALFIFICLLALFELIFETRS